MPHASQTNTATRPRLMAPSKAPLIGIAGGIASGKSFITEQFKLKGERSSRPTRWPRSLETGRGEKPGASAGVTRSSTQRPDRSPAAGSDRLRAGARWSTRTEAPGANDPSTHRPAHRQTARRAGARRRCRRSCLTCRCCLSRVGTDFAMRSCLSKSRRRCAAQRALRGGGRTTILPAVRPAQESLESKRKLADLVIDNSGTPAAAAAQVEQAWRRLVGGS